VDPRSNSIIVAGTPGDLDVVSAIIYRLDTEVQLRHSQVYHLKNAPAVDVANALNSFLSTSFTYNTANLDTLGYANVVQQVVIVPEPITNKLLISATDRYFAELTHLIQELDAEPPQVVIQVLIAEVDLMNTEEFGVEIGLQSPVLFRRSIFPAPFVTGASTTVSASTTPPSLLPLGASVSSSGTTPQAFGFPGFQFNQPTIFPGTNVLVSPPVVGGQGLTSLGVGRVSPTSGIGGLVLTASSDSFNLLVRALAQQGRIDVLSRPQVTTMDNQTARVFSGQLFPITLGSTATATGVISATVQQQSVGVQLSVTPRISPDGKVIMRVTPEVSSTAPTNVQLGNGITATAVNQQTVDTTVIAGDGETVALGGLITKRDDKSENKVPWLGDLPGVGALFRYRTQTKNKVELIIIMTPHIVRSRFDADRILSEETRRIDWITGDVLRVQGTSGMEPILRPPGGVPGVGGMPGPGGACLTPNGGSSVLPPLPAPSGPAEGPLPRRLPPPTEPSLPVPPANPAVNPAAPLSQNVPAPAGPDAAPVDGLALKGVQHTQAAPASPAADAVPPPDNAYGAGGPRVTTVTTPLVPVTQDAQPAPSKGKESTQWSSANKR
jgi:type II secretory pathway component GspD/PulD (secretin)